jgi:osmoprotectant transport system permease protein
MIVLGVPPILINTFSGIRAVESDLVEAGRGQGMSGSEILRNIELPLAVHPITAGIASAAIQIVATATLGAVLAFGGLGRYLVDGIAQGDVGQTIGGALLVGGLVVVTGAFFTGLTWLATPRGLRRNQLIVRV